MYIKKNILNVTNLMEHLTSFIDIDDLSSMRVELKSGVHLSNDILKNLFYRFCDKEVECIESRNNIISDKIFIGGKFCDNIMNLYLKSEIMKLDEDEIIISLITNSIKNNSDYQSTKKYLETFNKFYMSWGLVENVEPCDLVTKLLNISFIIRKKGNIIFNDCLVILLRQLGYTELITKIEGMLKVYENQINTIYNLCMSINCEFYKDDYPYQDIKLVKYGISDILKEFNSYLLEIEDSLITELNKHSKGLILENEMTACDLLLYNLHIVSSYENGLIIL